MQQEPALHAVHSSTSAPGLPLPAVYSMVKYAGVRNYVVGTWEAADLEACADLNLPCADVSSYLPEPMDHGENAGSYGTHDYLVSTLRSVGRSQWLASCRRQCGWKNEL